MTRFFNRKVRKVFSLSSQSLADFLVKQKKTQLSELRVILSALCGKKINYENI